MSKLFIVGLVALVVAGAIVRLAEIVAVVLVVKATLSAVSQTWRDRRTIHRFATARERLSAAARRCPVGRRVFYGGVNHPGSPAWFETIDAESREVGR